MVMVAATVVVVVIVDDGVCEGGDGDVRYGD